MRFLLAHLSDVHLGPLPRPRPADLLGKRLSGYLNWLGGRRRIHDMGVLSRLVGDLKAQRPDHVAMTGDILNIGLPAEFVQARTWLETLGRPHDVSFVPGNHDAYVRAALPQLAATFAPWTGDTGSATFPYMRVRGEVALIGLSSGVPTAPLLASGRLGPEQRDAFAAMLDAARRQGLVRVVMIHHPPHRAGGGFGRGLTDAAEFEAIIRRQGADLVLHGHNHRRSAAHLPAAGTRVPIVGVASGSAVPGTPNHRAAYHLFTIDIDGASLDIRARARGLRPGSDEIGDLGPIAL